MIKWYQAQEGCAIQHEGQVISPGKKIFLPEELAALHNQDSEQLVKCDEPKSVEEVGVRSEWDNLQSQKASVKSSDVLGTAKKEK